MTNNFSKFEVFEVTWSIPILKVFESHTIRNMSSFWTIFSRGGVEDTRLEAKAKAKDTKKIWGQGQGPPFRGQNLSRPRTGMLEAKAKDQGHSRKRSPKKGLRKNFFQTISNL